MANRRTKKADDPFRPQVGPPRQRGESFITQIVRQTSRSGAASRKGRHQPGARLGRGHVAARMNASSPRGRRVTVKTRLVNLGKAGGRSTATHLRYIEREGVGRTGEQGRAYTPIEDRAHLGAFETRSRQDRHQFRLIVSPEDAESLDDLRRYTRHLMERVESDLGTRLDWVAVDHWNTDNPHTHVVIRGVDDTGRDLVISRDYIAHGMRMRACELATEWLGQRSEREIQLGHLREVNLERLTGLDRTLLKEGRTADIALGQLNRYPHRQQLIGRLQHLNRLGLAHESRPGCWHIEESTERTLRTLGERGDIIRTMQRALAGSERELSVHEPGAGPAIVGQLLAKGLAGESHDRGYLIVDGTDGKAHHLPLAHTADLSAYPLGAIIDARSPRVPRDMDRQLASLAPDGWYRREHHRLQVLAQPSNASDPDFVLDAYERRLEALRRSGIVERLSNGHWRIPRDLVEQGQRHDAQRTGDMHVTVRARLSLERQIRALGATWLDGQLIAGSATLADRGFGAQARMALAKRADFLIEQGLAKREHQRVLLAPNLLSTLRERELETVGRRLAGQLGKPHHPTLDGRPVNGIYRRQVELVSGRYALLETDSGFSLVPWKPVIEARLGQSIAAVMRGGQVSWQLGRSRSPMID
ncbi:DUF3363 domain-containing protein [Stutzerimonas zhaodongensis]|uniref:DUF3363 domain-containing protein n=1 Tax=Stutzerimonas zhaodongensis TaxID=1176257 RepID=UPI0039F02FFE